MVIGLVLYMEDLELEEDYDAMIVKQRKSCGRRGSKESVVCSHVEANANKVQFYSSMYCRQQIGLS